MKERCIGTRNEKRCENTGEPKKKGWPYLCSECANEPARRGSLNTKGIVQEKGLTGNILYGTI